MKHKTIIEKVVEYMENGSSMNQAFAITALDRFAKQVVDNKEQVLKQMDNTFISGEAWVQSAQDWLKISDKE
jgi:hypothetical protein